MVKTLVQLAEERGMSLHTLKTRLFRWRDLDKALNTPIWRGTSQVNIRKLARESGISYQAVFSRIRNGESIEKAISRPSVKDRTDYFISKIRKGEPGECWEFDANTISRDGYLRIRFGGKRAMAHRVAWEILKGPIPDGLCVCHTCDNRKCCNPSHLFLGTKGDNNCDRTIKGRTHSKLNPHKVLEIREMSDKGVSRANLAELFGVTSSVISNIALRKAWKWVKEKEQPRDE